MSVRLDRLRQGLHAVLDIGTDHACRGFRAEGPALPFRVATTRADPEQLLLDHVRDGAHATLEDLRLLEQGCLDGLIAVPVGQAAGDGLEAQEGHSLGG